MFNLEGVNISPVVKDDTRLFPPPPYFSPAFLATISKDAPKISVAGYPSRIILPIIIAVSFRTVVDDPYNGFPWVLRKCIIAPFLPGGSEANPPDAGVAVMVPSSSTVTTYTSNDPPTAAPMVGPPHIILIPGKLLAALAAFDALSPLLSLLIVSTMAPSRGV